MEVVVTAPSKVTVFTPASLSAMLTVAPVTTGTELLFQLPGVLQFPLPAAVHCLVEASALLDVPNEPSAPPSAAVAVSSACALRALLRRRCLTSDEIEVEDSPVADPKS